jgi:hypothetical protein
MHAANAVLGEETYAAIPWRETLEVLGSRRGFGATWVEQDCIADGGAMPIGLAVEVQRPWWITLAAGGDMLAALLALPDARDRLIDPALRRMVMYSYTHAWACRGEPDGTWWALDPAFASPHIIANSDEALLANPRVRDAAAMGYGNAGVVFVVRTDFALQHWASLDPLAFPEPLRDATLAVVNRVRRAAGMANRVLEAVAGGPEGAASEPKANEAGAASEPKANEAGAASEPKANEAGSRGSQEAAGPTTPLPAPTPPAPPRSSTSKFPSFRSRVIRFTGNADPLRATPPAKVSERAAPEAWERTRLRGEAEGGHASAAAGGEGGYEGQEGYGDGEGGYEGQAGYGDGEDGYEGQAGYGDGEGGYEGQAGYGDDEAGYEGQAGYGDGEGGYEGQEGYGDGEGGYEGQEGYGDGEGGYEGQEDCQDDEEGGFDGHSAECMLGRPLGAHAGYTQPQPHIALRPSGSFRESSPCPFGASSFGTGASGNPADAVALRGHSENPAPAPSGLVPSEPGPRHPSSRMHRPPQPPASASRGPRIVQVPAPRSTVGLFGTNRVGDQPVRVNLRTVLNMPPPMPPAKPLLLHGTDREIMAQLQSISHLEDLVKKDRHGMAPVGNWAGGEAGPSAGANAFFRQPQPFPQPPAHAPSKPGASLRQAARRRALLGSKAGNPQATVPLAHAARRAEAMRKLEELRAARQVQTMRAEGISAVQAPDWARPNPNPDQAASFAFGSEATHHPWGRAGPAPGQHPSPRAPLPRTQQAAASAARPRSAVIPYGSGFATQPPPPALRPSDATDPQVRLAKMQQFASMLPTHVVQAVTGGDRRLLRQ